MGLLEDRALARLAGGPKTAQVLRETLGGAGSAVVVAVTADYAASSGDVVLGDASAGDFTVTAPAPTPGATVTVKNVGATGLVGIAPHAAEQIEGSSALSVARLAALSLVTDGTDWWVV